MTTKTPDNDRPVRREIDLSVVDEAQLRAWVDAGYMSAEAYKTEMDRRNKIRPGGAPDQ